MDCTEKENITINGGESVMSTSNTSTSSSCNGDNTNGCAKKMTITAPDATSYVAKARVTRPIPPPPSYNPMQFVQIKPCNLYQIAQQQIKKAEEVKKLKQVVRKEEPEDWQNNLDNWKSSRRKRVEHIIDRAVEVKKLELEEHDRTRRKAKTFSEMIEERVERGQRRAKLAALAIYNEDEVNDFSDLGIGTSSASGKSSLSEDYDNNSVLSDNAAELDKTICPTQNQNKQSIQQQQLQQHDSNSTIREYVSSPGYDTSSSTAPTSSPDPCEYTYEGAIQDYKQRVSRAASVGKLTTPVLNNNNNNGSSSSNNNNGLQSKEFSFENGDTATPIAAVYPTRRGSKIEDRLIGFEVTSPSDTQEGVEKQKVDVPKIDISKRKEIFESQISVTSEPKSTTETNSSVATLTNGNASKVVLRERLKFEANTNANGHNDELPAAKKEVKRLSGDITSIRDRMQSLEQQKNTMNATKIVDVPVPPLKERLSSLQNAVTKEADYNKKPPVALVDARQLEIMKKEEERMKNNQTEKLQNLPPLETKPFKVIIETVNDNNDEQQQQSAIALDRDDSGIHTSIDDIEQTQLQKEQEQQLNDAIAALALEEKQLEEAANAVNQIEAEFAELTDLNPAPLPSETAMQQSNTTVTATVAVPTAPTNDNRRNMEFSINEALELALEAIDKEAQQQQQTTHNQNIEKPNKTDEEKKQQSKQQTVEMKQEQQKQQQLLMIKTNEPIYENINPSMHELDVSNINISITKTKTTTAPTKTIANATLEYNQINKMSNSNNKMHKQIMNKCLNETIISKTTTTTTTTTTTSTTTVTTTTSATILKPAATAATTTTAKSNNNNNSNKNQIEDIDANEPYYQVPKSSEPYYDAPKHLRPIPVYENIEIFYNGLENTTTLNTTQHNSNGVLHLEPPKEKPPPPPIDSPPHEDELESVTSGELGLAVYETITANSMHPSPPIKRMNSTKRIKKELRNKRSSFLGIEANLDDEDSYLELTVAPPPDMAQLLQEERRLEKQLYIKAGLCDSSDTGESRDSGVSENHSRQSSEHYTNSSEEHDTQLDTPPQTTAIATVATAAVANPATNEIIYQNDALLTAAQTPLLQTVKGNSAESWTESATVAAAASQSLSEATATANAKMLSIEEKIREQEEVLRVERELLHFSQEELKRQRENLLLRENLARRELQHGAKMLMSANRRSLQDLHGLQTPCMSLHHNGMLSAFQPPINKMQAAVQQQPKIAMAQVQPSQQIYANLPNLQTQYYQMESEYRKSMSDLNEFSKRLILPATTTTTAPAPIPPMKPLRAMHISSNGHHEHTDELSIATRQRNSLNGPGNIYGGSLVKIANMDMAQPTAVQNASIYGHSYQHHQSAQNLSQSSYHNGSSGNNGGSLLTTAGQVLPQHGNMTRNTLHALSATPKPKYTDGWVQVQNNRKSYDSNAHLANDAGWLSVYQQKRKSMPDAGNIAYHNHWLVQEAEQRRLIEQQQQQQQQQQQKQNNNNRRSAPVKSNSNGKPLPDSIIQTLTERVQSKGIGERKRFDNNNYNQLNAVYQQTSATNSIYATHHHHNNINMNNTNNSSNNNNSNNNELKINNTTTATTEHNSKELQQTQDKVLSVSGKKKCSHCGDELGRGAAMIIESLLLFYHINCFKCCVCHVQLGDGLNGTDVRVRNQKLHCQNCYSSDDGIKFSCV